MIWVVCLFRRGDAVRSARAQAQLRLVRETWRGASCFPSSTRLLRAGKTLDAPVRACVRRELRKKESGKGNWEGARQPPSSLRNKTHKLDGLSTRPKLKREPSNKKDEDCRSISRRAGVGSTATTTGAQRPEEDRWSALRDVGTQGDEAAVENISSRNGSIYAYSSSHAAQFQPIQHHTCSVVRVLMKI